MLKLKLQYFGHLMRRDDSLEKTLMLGGIGDRRRRGFIRQEYWSGLPFPSPGDLPDPGIEPGSPALQVDALTSEPPGKPNGIYVGRWR